ncbi:alpha/beta family hydrolase [Jiangella asiatica]|uniref:alpha/beta hydrolase family protein n=1 Tax=Jiangella asiatica TaxID=2530372 RepID=UPI00193D206D|nr:alpha/beta family hydrolase [Jiangella asiatica]
MGEAAFWVDEADEPSLRLVLGHGAGGGPKAADLDALAGRLPAEGVSVHRFEQPWRLAGKKVAPRPPALDEAWLAAVATLPRDVPLVLGGRSSGARVACRTAQQLDAVAVVALAFPLHLPGKPQNSRLPELAGAAEKLPVLVVQGERDSFGGPGEFPPGPHQLVTVSHADHGMRVTKGHEQGAAIDAVVDAVRSFLAPFAAGAS